MWQKIAKRKMKRNKQKKVWMILCISLLSTLTLATTFIKADFISDTKKNFFLLQSLPLLFGSALMLVVLLWQKSGLFKGLKKWYCLLPCLLVAVNNFPFSAYFTGKSAFGDVDVGDVLLFACYCTLIGLFEEFSFRGVVFPLIADRFSRDKKGIVKTFFISSVLFGVVHLFNLFAGAGVGATLMQVGYSTLIGGMCAFTLMKCQNLLPCAFIHSVFDFCGMLLEKDRGLGLGVVFDGTTIAITAILGVFVAAYVLYGVFTYSEGERVALYAKFGGFISEKLDAEQKS